MSVPIRPQVIETPGLGNVLADQVGGLLRALQARHDLDQHDQQFQMEQQKALADIEETKQRAKLLGTQNDESGARLAELKAKAKEHEKQMAAAQNAVGLHGQYLALLGQKGMTRERAAASIRAKISDPDVVEAFDSLLEGSGKADQQQAQASAAGTKATVDQALAPTQIASAKQDLSNARAQGAGISLRNKQLATQVGDDTLLHREMDKDPSLRKAYLYHLAGAENLLIDRNSASAQGANIFTQPYTQAHGVYNTQHSSWEKMLTSAQNAAIGQKFDVAKWKKENPEPTYEGAVNTMKQAQMEQLGLSPDQYRKAERESLRGINVAVDQALATITPQQTQAADQAEQIIRSGRGSLQAYLSGPHDPIVAAELARRLSGGKS